MIINLAINMRRYVIATSAPVIKVRGVPCNVSAPYKRKWFGENTGVGSGEDFYQTTSLIIVAMRKCYNNLSCINNSKPS